MNEVRAVQSLVLGENRGRGNLLGIQPWMTPQDYATQDLIYMRLAGYLARARRLEWLSTRTVVVWPEHLATWLLTTGEAEAVREAPTLASAMRALAWRSPFRFIRTLLASPERDKSAAAVLRMHAQAAAERYQALFSQLAADYGVAMVAGSIVLPDPAVHAGRITAGKGPLYNVSAVFRPDGSVYPDLVRKAYPVGAELPFTTAGSPTALPVFSTHAGRLGVMICADAWYPASYTHLQSQGVELLAVPSHAAKVGAWHRLWDGYDGAPMPDDVDPSDVGRLTEAEAWNRYALAGRMADSGARAGINVFLGGKLWDLGTEGASMMVAADQAPVVAEPGRPALLNLWL
ncbi:MAG: hypothetical protein JXC32_14075 [Anaerolineae bacterium]|nr:hypothetical protein [Anaerolineae bacterium]